MFACTVCMHCMHWAGGSSQHRRGVTGGMLGNSKEAWVVVWGGQQLA